MRILPLLLLLLLMRTTSAQDEELPPDEAADMADLYVERGEDSLRLGSYEEARLRFEKALERVPDNKEARLGVARAHFAIGEYKKATEQIQKLYEHHAGDRDGKVFEARIALRYGHAATARDLARTVLKGGGEGPDPAGLAARLVLAEALAEHGKRDDARDVLDYFVKLFEQRHGLLADRAFHADKLRRTPHRARPMSIEMTQIARAFRMYVELSPLDYAMADNAIELVGYARELDPSNWEALTEFVRIFRVEKERSMAKARWARDKAAEQNPELADLYVEVAKSVALGFNEAEAKSLAATALRINPNHCDARAIVARVLLTDNEYGAAENHIEKGLEFNSRHKELLTLKATLDLLLGDKEGFEAGMKKVLEIDPTFGEGFHLAGLIVASRQRRFDRAVDLVRRGLKIDPLNSDAHASLGIFLANQGRAEDAVTALAESRKIFPFAHPVRENFKTVLDYVTGEMVELKTEHFTIRFDPSEFDIHGAFLPRLLEECWADMVKRYEFTPRRPILVECFRKADDFSVRTLGIPGIPALGACFGGLITLDSPQALPRNSFSWAGTARHEFAHVISLQLSGGQVPRWFTEGLSVLEEQPLDPGWGQNEMFERELFNDYHTDNLPKIATFDAMFRSSRVAYAYHVGGLMLEFLRNRSGEKGIVSALRLYGKDRPMREVFKKSFDLDLEQFDELFGAHIQKRVANYRIVPDYRRARGALIKTLAKNPADGETALKLAWAYFRGGRNIDAGAYLDRARNVLPKNNTHMLLLQARLAQRAGRAEPTRKLLQMFFDAGGDAYWAHMQMAAFLKADGETAGYVDRLKKAKAAWPLGVKGNTPYTLLRRYYIEAQMAPEALAELAAQTRIASTNIDIRLKLAREYRIMDQHDNALATLDEALNLHTFDRRAHSAMFELAREKKLWDRALRSGRALVRLLPDEADENDEAAAWLDLAEVAHDAGKREEALKALAETEKRNSDPLEKRVDELKKKLDSGQ
ncbi:MAG: tetratricopeptide repeat protein [Planctomycetota bacterium]